MNIYYIQMGKWEKSSWKYKMLKKVTLKRSPFVSWKKRTHFNPASYLTSVDHHIKFIIKASWRNRDPFTLLISSVSITQSHQFIEKTTNICSLPSLLFCYIHIQNIHKITWKHAQNKFIKCLHSTYIRKTKLEIYKLILKDKNTDLIPFFQNTAGIKKCMHIAMSMRFCLSKEKWLIDCTLYKNPIYDVNNLINRTSFIPFAKKPSQ